jgi:hypothetical protein
MSAQAQAYATKMLPVAQRAAANLSAALSVKYGQPIDYPVELVIAQWGWETGWGTSQLANNGSNNNGGIKFVGQAEATGASGGYAKYADLNRFADDWVRVLSLSRYKVVADAAAKSYPTQFARTDAIARALGSSDYAGSHYAEGGYPGGSINLALKEFTLPTGGLAVVPTDSGLQVTGIPSSLGTAAAAVLVLAVLTAVIAALRND